jgi:putative phosphoesterase
MRNDVDPAWRLLGAEILLEILKALQEESEGAKTREDVENVHRMRVASRRIRSAMSIFEDCFPTNRFKSWMKEVRKVTRALGEARDADVQIELIGALEAEAGRVFKSGLEMLMHLKQGSRDALQGPLLMELEKVERSGLVLEMEEFLLKTRQAAMEAGATTVRVRESFVRASVSVRRRVEGLVRYEASVHQEDAIAEHHAMRIAAKRLRYTAEAFGPLFDDGLKQELSWMKRLQELLGDLHDCDVWIADAQSANNALKEGKLILPNGSDTVGLQSALTFLERNRGEERKKTYGAFVDFWEDLTEAGAIDLLQRRMNQAAEQTPDLTASAIEMLVNDPKANVAVLGDIHGNLQALQAVLMDAKARGAEVILNTGDVLGYGANPEEAIHLLRSIPSISVIGNYDLKSFRIGEGIEEWPGDKANDKLIAFRWAYENISLSSREWLRSLPKEVRLEAGGMRLLMVHGSPDSMDEHLGPETPEPRLKSIADDAGADVIITGHSHRQMSRSTGKVRFINPGSVGRQDDGNPLASYVTMRLRPFRASLHRVPYDTKGAAKAVREAGLPEAFAQMLLEGRSYDFIAGKAKEGTPDAEDIYGMALRVSRSYLGEDRHSDQVTRLAMQLFDCLKGEMKMTEKDGQRLRCAAILHDIGWVEGRKGHHKASLRMILEEDALPFDRTERRVVGCIARYHRKALPNEEHAHFSTLNKSDKRTVKRLSAILRVADALDFTHEGKVDSIRCELTPDKIIIHGSATGDLEMEEREALKKGDLIQKVLGRDLELLWDVA